MTHAIRPNLLFALSRHKSLDINIQQVASGGWQVTVGAAEQTVASVHPDPAEALWLALLAAAPE